MSDTMTEWRKQGLHLPPCMRDFHAQKDIFKAIDSRFEALPPEYAVNWRVASVYTIDRFLWFMAAHGYTLQKCRAKLAFRSLDETLKEEEDRQLELLDRSLASLRTGEAKP